jgi:hypothetical protein
MLFLGFDKPWNIPREKLLQLTHMCAVTEEARNPRQNTITFSIQSSSLARNILSWSHRDA